jgi:DNA-binding transcriptional regulator YdaS (Cro superfamily)
MAHENPTQVVLRSAVDAVGGAEQLAASLGISRTDLDAWMAGNGTPPQGVLMDALELATYQAQLKDVTPEQRRQ